MLLELDQTVFQRVLSHLPNEDGSNVWLTSKSAAVQVMKAGRIKSVGAECLIDAFVKHSDAARSIASEDLVTRRSLNGQLLRLEELTDTELSAIQHAFKPELQRLTRERITERVSQAAIQKIKSGKLFDYTWDIVAMSVLVVGKLSVDEMVSDLFRTRIAILAATDKLPFQEFEVEKYIPEKFIVGSDPYSVLNKAINHAFTNESVRSMKQQFTIELQLLLDKGMRKKSLKEADKVLFSPWFSAFTLFSEVHDSMRRVSLIAPSNERSSTMLKIYVKAVGLLRLMLEQLYKEATKFLLNNATEGKRDVPFLWTCFTTDVILALLDALHKHTLLPFWNKNIPAQVQSTRCAFEAFTDESLSQGLEQIVELTLRGLDEVFQHNYEKYVFDIDGSSMADMKPTKCCSALMFYLKQTFEPFTLLLDEEVAALFYREIFSQFLQLFLKNLRKHHISRDGGFQLICDINQYSSLAERLKLAEDVLISYRVLKELANLFIVDADGLQSFLEEQQTRFREQLRTQDLMEFVALRKDWRQIKRRVDPKSCLIS